MRQTNSIVMFVRKKEIHDYQFIIVQNVILLLKSNASSLSMTLDSISSWFLGNIIAKGRIRRGRIEEYSWAFCKDEIEQLNSVLKSGETTLHIAQEDDNDKDSVCQTFLVSDEAYTRFMKVLDRGAKIPEPFKTVWRATEVSSEWAPNEEVANVGGYMVIQRLAPILKLLLSKHGDISATSMLRPMVKIMMNTNVVDIKEDLLCNWWTSLKILQFANFEIQFAFDNLKRVVHAYFGLHIKKEVDNTLDKIDREIQALKDKRKCIITAKSNLIEECLREASILKHGKAGPKVELWE
ncbi:putative leucine-rich repeat receptor-like protein kinase [Fagus crenata]